MSNRYSHDSSQTIPGQSVILLEGGLMKGSVDNNEAEHELGKSQAGVKKNKLDVWMCDLAHFLHLPLQYLPYKQMVINGGS